MGIYWWRADHYCLNYHSLLSFVFLFKVAEHSFARALADARAQGLQKQTCR